MSFRLADRGVTPAASVYGTEMSADPATGPAAGAAVRPPVWALAGALASLVLSGILMVAGGEWAHGAGWALSSFVSIGFLAAYSRLDLRRAESEPRYVYRPDLARLRTVLAVIAFAGAVAHAWRFATMVAS
jgi:hypothetical protein